MSKFLDNLSTRMRLERKSQKTIQAYMRWIKAFILANNTKHPLDLQPKDVEIYLSSLADTNAKSTQKQAFFALKYLYDYLDRPLPVIRAKRSQQLPQHRFALSKQEVQCLLQAFQPGKEKIIGGLLYGSGLRVSEVAKLRIKDLLLDSQQIHVHNGKGDRDRVVFLSHSLLPDLSKYITYLKTRFNKDMTDNLSIPLPGALARKYPNAQHEWKWSWLFPSRCRKTQIYPISVNTIQKIISRAAEQALPSHHITPHILRHTFATHYLQQGGRIEDLKELMGHQNIQTTMGYVHPFSRKNTISSPLDSL